MNLVLKLTLGEESLGSAGDEDGLRALVLFEDAAAGSRAMVALDRVAREIEGTGTLVLALWRLELLASKVSMGTLADEAASADVIIFALGPGAKLPAGINEWFSLWIGREGGRALALGAIVGGEEGQHGAAAAVEQLRQIASLGEMEFFATGGAEGGIQSLGTALHKASRAAGRGGAEENGAPFFGVLAESKGR